MQILPIKHVIRHKSQRVVAKSRLDEERSLCSFDVCCSIMISGQVISFSIVLQLKSLRQ